MVPHHWCQLVEWSSIIGVSWWNGAPSLVSVGGMNGAPSLVSVGGMVPHH
ncbi:unnamed protein product, partial [Staurois parvus]